jgi:competence protein ComEC
MEFATWSPSVDRPVGLLIGLSVIAGVILGWVACATFALLVIASWLLGSRWSPYLVIVLLVCTLTGWFVAALHGGGVPPADIGASERATGEIVTMPVARPSGDRAVLRLQSLEVDNVRQDAGALVVVFLPAGTDITIGDRVTVIWQATPVDRAEPGLATFVRSQGAVAMAHIFVVTGMETGRSPLRWLVDMRRAISDRFADMEPGDTSALMSGLVTGDDSRLSDATREAFSVTGTGHITAVSGSNVAMLVALWYRFLARNRRSRLWVAGGLCLTIWTYCAMTGLEPSAVRAASVATFVIGGSLLGRRSDAMTALALVTAGLLLVRPEWQFSLGFWLSTVASGALAWSFRDIDGESPWRAIRDTATGLMMAQLATLPIIAWTFGTVTPAGIVANLVLSPIMALAFPLTFAYCLIAFIPGVSTALLFVPAAPNDVAIGVVTRLAEISPVWRLDLSTPLALGLVAVPCLAIVAAFSADAQRWWQRSRTMSPMRRAR